MNEWMKTSRIPAIGLGGVITRAMRHQVLRWAWFVFRIIIKVIGRGPS